MVNIVVGPKSIESPLGPMVGGAIEKPPFDQWLPSKTTKNIKYQQKH